MAEYWKYNKEFKGKVEYEMVNAAIAIMAEAADTVNHAERVIYAKTILDGTYNKNELYTGFATNSTIKSHLIANTDYTSDLAFVAGSLFNAFAGVSLQEIDYG